MTFIRSGKVALVFCTDTRGECSTRGSEAGEEGNDFECLVVRNEGESGHKRWKEGREGAGAVRRELLVR